MADKKQLARWRATQEHWDDAEFLTETANAFMRLRWKRLNQRAAAMVAERSKSLGRGIDLVDVGCAHADFYDWSKGSLRAYRGIEPSKALLKKDIKRPGFSVQRGVAERLPLPAACADFVLIKEVLDHCHTPSKVLAEAFRVLRPSGRCLITLTNDQAWYKELFPKWAARIKAGQDDHLFFFKPAQSRALYLEAGFTALDSDDSHYLRLPYRVEELIGSLPDFVGKSLISLSDGIGSLILPDMGGSFWSWADKPLTPRKASKRKSPRR